MIAGFKYYHAYKVWYTYPNKSYLAKDIETFSRLIPALLEGKYCSFCEALYLNNLINHCKDKKISIYTSPECLFVNMGFDNNKKNVTGGLGNHMSGGEITVNGSAGDEISCHMLNGEIRLNGDYSSLSRNYFGGQIYHKGRLIVDKGRLFA